MSDVFTFFFICRKFHWGGVGVGVFRWAKFAHIFLWRSFLRLETWDYCQKEKNKSERWWVGKEACMDGSLSQWLNFKLFGITYLVGKISPSNFFFQGPLAK